MKHIQHGLGAALFFTRCHDLEDYVISQSTCVCMLRVEVFVQRRAGFLYGHCLASCKLLLCFAC